MKRLSISHRICAKCAKDKTLPVRFVCSGCLRKFCKHSAAITHGLCDDCRAAGTPSRTGESVA